MSIDISKDNIAGRCNTKCAYSFAYQDCGLNAVNNGAAILFSLNPVPSVPPVLYNNKQYKPEIIYLLQPSIHTYDGIRADAEIVILHSPVDGGNGLYITIPITKSTDSSSASVLIDKMVNESPEKQYEEIPDLNVENFSLNTIVPKSPFFSYSKNNTDFIVFPKSIPLSEATLTILKSITLSYSIQTEKDTETKIFYNGVGPKSTLADQGIYIDCQPTGSSGEVDIVTARNPPVYDMDTIMKDPTMYLIIQLIVSCIIFVVIYMAISYGFSIMTSTNTTPIKKI
jgi:hypothetical protein